MSETEFFSALISYMKPKYPALADTLDWRPEKWLDSIRRIRALREFAELKIEETIDTIKASYGEKLVFSAVQKHEGGPWITRQMKGLFTRTA